MYVVAVSEKPDPLEQTIETIEDCMSRSPNLWLDEWKKEYIDTIRKAILSHQEAQQYNLKMEILCRGFAPYWEGLTKSSEKSLFEVHMTQIRWYIEHLMSTKFPSEEERQTLHDQFNDIWNYAAKSLIEQFPFLDPNTVQTAKQDDLNICYRKIDTPLEPVYMWPMTEEKVKQIKQRWDKLRYIRVDLLRRLDSGSTIFSVNNSAPSLNTERDYQLTKKSLSQLLGQIWIVVSERPDYYISALKNRSRTIQESFQSRRQAWNNESNLEKGRSRQVLQTEHIGFLLSALLDMAKHVNKSASVNTQDQIPSEQQDKSSKGGGAYETEKYSQEK
jgi:hypothetical protein